MPELVLTLAGTRQETRDVRSFLFTPSAPVGHRAGQYLMLRMEAPGDPRGPSRTFTMASSPTEDRIMITTRLTASPFKQRLAGLPPGTELKARAPIGIFTLPDPPISRVVFLADGIGVTPFRAMGRYATDVGLPTQIDFLYSSLTPEDIVFRGELEDLARRNPRLRIVTTITRPEDSMTPWSGPTGHLDTGFLREHAGRLDDAVVYTAGPPSMVDAMLAAAASLGVPKERVRAERFTGY